MVNFPTSLDTLTNPTSKSNLDGSGPNSLVHSVEHGKLNDIVEALEAKVGVDSSDVTTSHDYKLGRVQDLYNVKAPAYGATGDGVADDTTAIQAAATAASNAGGGIIYLPEGTYKTTAKLTIPANCILRGSNRVAATIDIQHTGDGIELTGIYSGIESLKVNQPNSGTVGSGILVGVNKTHLRDLQCSGGVNTSWAIDVDHANICCIENTDIGGDGDEGLTGNGIVFRNTDVATYPFNFGDCLLSKVDVQLPTNTADVVGIKFQGPDSSSNKINNILMAQVEVTGGPGNTDWATSTAYAVNDIIHDADTNELYQCDVMHTSASSGTFADDRTANPTYWSLLGDAPIGVHIYNSARICMVSVDLENLSIAVKHEGAQNGGALSDSCSFFSVYVLGTTTAYSQNGTVTKVSFMGCDNFPDSTYATGFTDGSWITSGPIYIIDANGNPSLRLLNNSGRLRLSDGADDGSLEINVSGGNPSITPVETGGGARMFLGNTSIRTVDIQPAAQFYTNTSASFSTTDGSVAYSDGSGWDPLGYGNPAFVFRENGTWIGLNGNLGIYNIVDFGAKGDGSTDDATAIQAAIDACETAGGGTVWVPAGDYKVNSSLTINSDGVSLIGESRAVSRIFTATTSVTPLKVGTLSTSTKISYVTLQDVKIEAASSADAGVYALQVYGATFFNATRVTILEGDSGLYVRNLDRFTFTDVDVECNDTSSTIVHLDQGQTDDVTIGSFVGLNASIRAASQVALRFGDAVGSSNANEFNRIAFIGGRLGGDSVTGSTLIYMEAGCRNVTFQSMQLRYGRTASLDCTNADSTYRIRMKFITCAFFGDSANDTVDHIKANQSDHMITIEDSQFDNGVDHISCEGNNPRIVLRNNEYSNATNLVNITAGTPRISISGYHKIGGTVTTNINGSGEIRFSSDTVGDWESRVEGTVTIASGNTSQAETWTALDWTPDKRDINFTQDASTTNPIGAVWLTSVSGTGATWNCENDPGVGGAVFKYRVSR